MEFQMQSESVSELNLALVEAKKNFQPLVYNKKSSMYRYADLTAIFEAILPALVAAGIEIKQPVIDIDDKRWLYTRLDHGKSGQFYQTRIEIDKPNDCDKYCNKNNDNLLWGYGSQITYLKRYSISSMFCLSADEDTDAIEFTKEKTKEKSKPALVEDIKKSNEIVKISDAQIHLYNQKIIGKEDIHNKILETFKLKTINDLERKYFNSILEQLK